MKILLYGLNYAPELTGVGKYTGEMAEWLAARGHEVRVITAPPYYPQWRVGAGYSAGRYARESRHSVDIWRCPIWVPAHASGLKRLIHLLSFAASSVPVILGQRNWRPDVVWVAEPTLFCAPAGLLLARLAGSGSWLHIQDYEVDAAFDLGLLRGKSIRRLMSRLERLLMRRFDRVSTISSRMLKHAIAKGVEQDRLVLFPNWVDLRVVDVPDGPNSFRADFDLPPTSIVALYSGNMGLKQGLEILAEAAERLQRDPDLLFVFSGAGAGRAALEQRCVGLPNVVFLDLQPADRLGALLTMADIHLLPQRADAADLVLPSKLNGIMASGRPVIATSREGTELAQVVGERGLVVPPEDTAALVTAIQRLARDKNERDRLGAAGRLYAEEYLSQDGVLQEFEASLEQLVRARERGSGSRD